MLIERVASAGPKLAARGRARELVAPLPPPLTIPTIVMLTTLADVRELEGQFRTFIGHL